MSAGSENKVIVNGMVKRRMSTRGTDSFLFLLSHPFMMAIWYNDGGEKDESGKITGNTKHIAR